METIKSPFPELLIIAGESGVGKSAIIAELLKDKRFVYPPFFITRAGREGEVSKIHIEEEEMDEIEQCSEYIVLKIFGVRYAVAISSIVDTRNARNFPVTDWPIQYVEQLTALFPSFVVYLSPPSQAGLEWRMQKDKRDNYEVRLQAAEEELAKITAGVYSRLYDLQLISETGQKATIAKTIRDRYIANMNKISDGDLI